MGGAGRALAVRAGGAGAGAVSAGGCDESDMSAWAGLDLGRYCAALRGASAEALAAAVEVTLEGIETDREATDALGLLLPALERLKLRSSTLGSLRDLGPLSRLRVLCAPRCGLTDLEGIAALEQVEEVYLAFNEVADCTALALHDRLAVLDLEGNRLGDWETGVEPLATCPRLVSLTVLGNPLILAGAGGQATRGDRRRFRDRVRLLLPGLQFLDEEPLLVVSSEEEAPREDRLALLPEEDEELSLSSPLAEEDEVVAEALKVFRLEGVDSPARRRRGRTPPPRSPGSGAAPSRSPRRPTTAPAAPLRTSGAYSCWEEMLDIRGGRRPETEEDATASSLMTHGGNALLAGSIARGMRRSRRPQPRRSCSRPRPRGADSSAASGGEEEDDVQLDADLLKIRAQHRAGEGRRRTPPAIGQPALWASKSESCLEPLADIPLASLGAQKRRRKINLARKPAKHGVVPENPDAPASQEHPGPDPAAAAWDRRGSLARVEPGGAKVAARLIPALD